MKQVQGALFTSDIWWKKKHWMKPKMLFFFITLYDNISCGPSRGGGNVLDDASCSPWGLELHDP